MKTYNQADHRAAKIARRDAIIFLKMRGYSWKSIGYAFHKTGYWASCIWYKAKRGGK